MLVKVLNDVAEALAEAAADAYWHHDASGDIHTIVAAERLGEIRE